MLLRPRQRVFVERSLAALGAHDQTLAVAPTGCHAPGTPILMFDGSVRPVEDIRVGDALMGPDSRPRRVLRLHRGDDEMYEIRPLKGEPFVVNGDHVLSLVRTNAGKPWSGAGTVINLTVRDYMQSSRPSGTCTSSTAPLWIFLGGRPRDWSRISWASCSEMAP